MTLTPSDSAPRHTDDGSRILLEARFDPRLKHYFMLQALLIQLVTFFGIILIPFWALLIGPVVHRRQYEALECELTERSLNFRRGFLFRVQKNVPLDKITDLALNEGPILRFLGLCSLTIETAGGGAGTAMGQAALVGIMDPVEFRNAVIRQRDLAVSGQGSRAIAAEPQSDASGQVLEDIRDSLGRIEKMMAAKKD
ncbi:MAG: PH domain-containing protein [Planctomycetota bacterium]|jgi:putative membrane protein|nr:PH domain-containing protein [Planctomycetota bacterium]